jgi:peptidoglycan/LPS O-acetylase OafA/YrhL
MEVETHYLRYLNRKHFGSLDGLRAISILGVIWSHGPGHGAASVLLRSGSRGVDLFFAISGFLITTLLLRELRSQGSISLKRFYIRRALRIFPLYYVVLAFYVVLALARQTSQPGSRQFLFNLPYFLTYTANWFVPPTATFGFAWSLAIEEQFYCVWPWVEKYAAQWAAAAMLGGVVVVYAVQQSWVAAPGLLKLLTSQVAPSICLGVLAAHLLSTRRGYKLAFHCIGYRAAPLVLLASTAWLITMRVDLFVPGLPYALIVAACVIREDHWMSPVLANRFFAWIGSVSYGMYLIHGTVYRALEVFRAHSGVDRYGLPLFMSAVLLTVLAATISHRYYESRFLNLKKRFAK